MLTISIPIYRSNNVFLKEAIDSVLAQSVDRWQLLLIDGGPEENAFAQSESERDERITYVRNDSDRTMAGNWNMGLISAKSDLVTLLHDDDYLAPNYVEKMLSLAERNPLASLYFCRARVVNEEGVPLHTLVDSIKSLLIPSGETVLIEGDTGLSSLLNGCFIFCPTIMYRKSRIYDCQFKSQWKMVTDLQFYFDLLLSGGYIVGVKQALYNYRRHSSNQTVVLSQNISRFEEELAIYQWVYHEANLRGWFLSSKRAHHRIILRLHMLYYATFSRISIKLRAKLIRLVFAFN